MRGRFLIVPLVFVRFRKFLTARLEILEISEILYSKLQSSLLVVDAMVVEIYSFKNGLSVVIILVSMHRLHVSPILLTSNCTCL